MAAEESIKFYLASQMQSAAPLLLSTLLDERLARNRTLGEPCRQQLVRVSSGALRNELWALSVFDSLGKPRPGLARGSIFNLVGDQDQCQAQAHFKYCQAQVELRSGQLGQLLGRPESFFEPIAGAPRHLKLGLCVPRACSPDELGALAEHMLAATAGVDCAGSSEPAGPDPWPAATWLSLVVLAALVALVGAASLLGGDHGQRAKRKQRQRHSCSRNGRLSSFIEAFSSLQTARRLLLARPSPLARRPPLDLGPLDGLRALSTLWIIAVHSYSFAFQWLLFDNLDAVDDVYKSPWSQWLGNGTFALDTFLLISGLLAYLNSVPTGHSSGGKAAPEVKPATNEANQNGLRPALARLVGRYLRLAPTLALLILLSLGLLPLLSRGPRWASGTQMFDEWCRPGQSWLLNLLLAHNLINTRRMCFSHSWYAGVDFQLFALLQLVLWLRRDNKNKAPSSKGALVALIGAAQLSVAYLVHAHNLTYLPQLPAQSLQSMLTFQGKLFIKPHHWLASYFLGALLAIHLLEPRQGKRNARSSWLDWLQLLVPAGTMLGLLLLSLPYFRATLLMSGAQSTVVALLARPLWSLALARLLFVMLRQEGAHGSWNSLARRRSPSHILELTRRALGSSLWRPLSRISYPAYLLHPPLMAAFYASRTQTFQFSHALLLYFTLGHTVLTYAGALALHLLLEAPASHLAGRLKLELAPGTRSPSSSSSPPPVKYQEPIKSGGASSRWPRCRFEAH